MKSSTLFSFLFSMVKVVSAATITYNWDATWVQANPDNRLSRPVVGINNKWPCPTISGNVGDTIVVTLNNKLGNETTSLHWHGLYQAGSNANDGPPMVTQCPILPGQSYTYTFRLDQPGTYWYHSHSPGQYADGLRGPLIIHDPKAPFAGKYDGELVLSLADWYHSQTPVLIPQYLDPTINPEGGEPVPYSALMNEQMGAQFPVVPGKTYLVRVINMAAFAQVFLHFDQHEMTIVEADGIYTVPAKTTDLYVATAQRYSVLITMKKQYDKNFAILAMMDQDKFDNIPDYLQTNVTGVLVYDKTKPIPKEAPSVAGFNPVDEFTLIPLDKMPVLGGKPDVSITLDLDFELIDGMNRASFNNITYIPAKVPTLYTALSAGKDATNPLVYGNHTNPHVVKQGQLVEIVINNFDGGVHPIHLHGHVMAMVARGAGIFAPLGTPKTGHNRGSYGASPATKANNTFGYTPGVNDDSRLKATPMRRDTWMLAPSAFTVFRFKATNPGVWLLHCHMEWHVEAGLTATIIEAPLELQQQQKYIPQAMANICKAQGIPTVGNAAGNSKNFLDLTGENVAAEMGRGSVYP